MNEKKMYQEIKQGNFDLVKKYFDQHKIKIFSRTLGDVCWKHPEKIISDFLEFLIKNEKNISKKVFYYGELHIFLTMVLYGSRSDIKKNIAFGKKILKDNPKNLKIKKLFLFDYFHPDLSEYVTKKEIKKIALDVLKKEPNNKKAKEVLERLGK